MSSLLSLFSTQITNLFSTPKETFFVKTTPFGSSEWEKLGIKVEAPEIPAVLLEAMKKTCPFWPSYNIEETHFLCLIPKGMNALKLRAFLDKNHASSVEEEPAKESYWVLITKKTVPGSRELNFESQKQHLAQSQHKVPKMVEAAVAVIGGHFEQFTRCQEEHEKWPVAIGSDSSARFSLLFNDWNHPSGVAGVFSY